MLHDIIGQLKPFLPLILDVKFKGEESANLVTIPGFYKNGIRISHRVASLSLEGENLQITIFDQKFLDQLNRAAKEFGKRFGIKVIIEQRS
jgi:hypothetical protein